jgi:hypothetical protein
MQSAHGNEAAIRKVVHDTLSRNPLAPVDVVLANWCRQRDGGPNAIEFTRVAQIYDEEHGRLSQHAAQRAGAKRRWWHPW